MRYKKGLVYLFKALSRLRDRYPFTLLLAGDFFSPEEEKIHLGQLDELGLRDRTVITGKLPRAAMFDHFPLYDVMVFPSLFAEGCPLSMMESMTMGRAIVGSRTGAIPEILTDGESGLLVDPGDSEGIERALVRLLEDPGERARLGEGALSRSRELSPERELGAWLEVYEEVLGERVPGSGIRRLASTA
jgi:glycosyltransferase involved in cell wall biosynthesis